MQNTLGFNLIRLFDQLWVPDIWEIIGAQAITAKLDRRCTLVQWQALAQTADPALQRALQAASELTTDALTAHFCKAEGKKKAPILTDLWADKTVKPLIERYIYRKLEVFYSNAHAARAFMCIDAARKPVLSHHTLTWADSEAHGLLHLERTTDLLQYRLEVTHAEKTCAFADMNVLAPGTPAWFVLDKQIVRLQNISGKMIVPFQTKEIIEVSRTHEATWFRQFLKKNLDGAAEVQATGFAMEQHNTLQYTQLQPFKHLFSGAWMLSVDFHYHNGVTFHPGEKTALRSLINIPDDPSGEVAITRIERQLDAEQTALATLLQLGLEREEQHFKLPTETDLSALVTWVHKHRAALERAAFRFDLQHPDSGVAICTDTPEMEVVTTTDRDWFDAHIHVRIGARRVPFKAFVGHIRQRLPEFTLPDGSLFLIPDAWFTRYHELAQLAASQQDEQQDEANSDVIRIGKLQAEVLESLDLQAAAKQAPAPLKPLATDTSVTDPNANLSPIWSENALLQATLRPYQQTGIDWMLHLLQGGFGACLADDMGLGKTLQTIAVLTHIKAQKARILAENAGITRQMDIFTTPDATAHQPLQTLVVVPASLVFNWQAELRRFAPDLFVYAHTGARRLTDRRAIAAHDVVLTTYHTCREDIALLTAIDWQCVVLDEAQNIKNRNADLTKAVYKLPAAHRLALSGTPIENSLADLWSLMHFLNPSLLGTYASFSKMYQAPIEKERDPETKKRLTERVRPFMLRRRKQEVAPDLPALSRQVLLVPMTEAQADLYEKTKSAARNSLLHIGQDAEFRFAALQALMRLRQMACHPALLPAEAGVEGVAFGKLDAVLQVWQSLIDQGSKVLIFSSFEQHLRAYERHFQAEKTPYAWISGSTPTDQRRTEVERFQTQPEVGTFFITLKAGGTGLNLTAADYVFILDPWWNPQAEEQAIARAHRIGQERPVHAIRFITSGTIEEKIMLMQAEKHELGAGMIDDELPAGMSVEEVRALLG